MILVAMIMRRDESDNKRKKCTTEIGRFLLCPVLVSLWVELASLYYMYITWVPGEC